LFDERFVKMILRLNVSPDDVGKVSFGGKGSSGGDSDYEETQGDDDKKRGYHP
jgi:hypothetical protein